MITYDMSATPCGPVVKRLLMREASANNRLYRATSAYTKTAVASVRQPGMSAFDPKLTSPEEIDAVLSFHYNMG